MSYLSVLGSSSEKLWSYLKVAPSNLSYCKVWCKNKNAIIWNQKMPFFGCFMQQLSKSNIIFEFNPLELVLLQSLGKN